MNSLKKVRESFETEFLNTKSLTEKGIFSLVSKFENDFTVEDGHRFG